MYVLETSATKEVKKRHHPHDNVWVKNLISISGNLTFCLQCKCTHIFKKILLHFEQEMKI